MLKKLSVLLVFILIAGCSQTYQNQVPIGKIFPSVQGEALDKQIHQLPDYFAKRPVILLMGYKQNSQFDIDRWLIGLDMTESTAEIYELPTIQGWAPRMAKNFINEGMRKGIPEELWSIVITVYKDGETLQQFTGNQSPNNARVVVLDQAGKVRHFYDRGFSVTALKQVNKVYKSLLPVQ